MVTPEDSPPGSERPQEAVKEILQTAQGWLIDGLEKLSRQGITLQRAVRVAHDADVEKKILGSFKSVPQIKREIFESVASESAIWDFFFAREKIPVSREAIEQIYTVELSRHPLAPLVQQKDDHTIFARVLPGPPGSLPHLRFDFLKSLWAIVEDEQGIGPDPDVGAAFEKWAAEMIVGASSDISEDLPNDTLFALHIRVTARLVGNILKDETQALAAALKPEWREKISAGFEQNIEPKIMDFDRRLVEDMFDGGETFPWLKDQRFRSFLEQPSHQTFCESLRKYGYELLAKELEDQPEACEQLINDLTPFALEEMEDERAVRELEALRPEIEALLKKEREAEVNPDDMELEEIALTFIDYLNYVENSDFERAEELKTACSGKSCEISLANLQAVILRMKDEGLILSDARKDALERLVRLLKHREGGTNA